MWNGNDREERTKWKAASKINVYIFIPYLTMLMW